METCRILYLCIVALMVIGATYLDRRELTAKGANDLQITENMEEHKL